MFPRLVSLVGLGGWLAGLAWGMWRLRRANPPLPRWRALAWRSAVLLAALVLALWVRLPLHPPLAHGEVVPYVPVRRHFYPLLALPWLVVTLRAGQMAGAAVAFATGLALLFGAREGFWAQPLIHVSLAQGVLGLWLAARRRWSGIRALLVTGLGVAGLTLFVSLGQAMLWVGSALNGRGVGAPMTWLLWVLWDGAWVAAEIFLAWTAWTLAVWFRHGRRGRPWFEGLLQPLPPAVEPPVAEAFFRHQFLPALFSGSVILALAGFFVIENVLQIREMSHLAQLNRFVQAYAVTLDQEVQRRFARIYRQLDPDDPVKVRQQLEQRLQNDPLFSALAFWDAQRHQLIGVGRSTHEAFSTLTPAEADALRAVTRYSFGRPLWVIHTEPGDLRGVLTVLWAPSQTPSRGVLLARLWPRLNAFFLPIQTLFDTLPQSGVVGGLLQRDQNRLAVVSRGYEGWLGMALPLAEEQQIWMPMAIRGHVYWVYMAPAPRPAQVSWRPGFFLDYDRFLDTELWALGGMLAFSGLASLIALVTGMRYFEQLHLELQHLETQAQWLAQGNFQRPVRGGTLAETHQVTRAFEVMRRRLQAYVQGLRQLLDSVLGLQRLWPYDQAGIQRLLRAALPQAAVGVRLVADARLWDPEAPAGTYRAWGAGPRGEALARWDETYFREGQTRDARLWRGPGPDGLDVLGVGLYDNQTYLGALVMAWPRGTAPELQGPYLKTLAAQWQTTLARWRLLQQQEAERHRLLAVLDALPVPLTLLDGDGRARWLNRRARQIGLREGARPFPERCPAGDEAPGPRAVAWRQTVYDCYRLPVPRVAGAEPWAEDVLLLLPPQEGSAGVRLRAQFMTAIGDELRNPLTLIRGYARMLELVGDLSEQQRSFLAQLQAAVERMGQRIAALVAMGRADLGMGLRVQSVDVAGLLRALQEAIEPLARQRGIRLHVHPVPAALPRIEADGELLYLALYQVLDNALKFNRPDGEIHLLVQEGEPGTMRFVVADTGTGIASVDLARLEELLTRPTPPSPELIQRYGLGMLLVRSVVQLHGGRVLIESRLGYGTTVILELPVHQPRPAGGEPPAPTA